MWVDTHCHIHSADFPLPSASVMQAADSAEVKKLICVGTTADDSRLAVAFSNLWPQAYAAIGIHPNENDVDEAMALLEQLATNNRVVAIGECGLDYYYHKHPKALQQARLTAQFELASSFGLPMIFHIRGSKDDPHDAFVDFWRIYDSFLLPGVVHSFSAQPDILEQILDRKLYIGVNGIATFLKPGAQLTALQQIPLESMVLETDAPLLTPVPFRGSINEPKHIPTIAAFLHTSRNESIKHIAATTTNNARKLFNF